MWSIAEVTEATLAAAGAVHSAAWQASHSTFCSPEFVVRHSPAAQTDYLRREMAQGKRLYLLTDGTPVGLVSVWGSLIENLYILPERQGRGLGTRLLEFAIGRCEGTPTLWLLSNNTGAHHLYLRHGFVETGLRRVLRDDLYEFEMKQICDVRK